MRGWKEGGGSGGWGLRVVQVGSEWMDMFEGHEIVVC